MKLSIYNTLTRQQQVFEPISAHLVKMYVCGPTVYDRPHIGNARSVVIYDMLYRILTNIYGFNHVVYVRNITDVDDKIIFRAKELNISINALTTKTTEFFHSDMDYLNCLQPNIEPKATEHIDEMIAIIQSLLDQNYAYISENCIYFDTSKASNYLELSGRSIDEMIHSVRIEADTAKRNQSDFILWKAKKDNEDLSANFDSPWTIGRPGWHIECSAMSHKYLGENFDIHGGGADLIFPHHTNEIAQSTCAFAKSKFANYWVHNGFLTVNGEKMSKSLGNFITVNDLRDKQISGEVLRLFFINTHYRKPLDYNDKSIADAHKTINYWYKAIEDIDIAQADNQELPRDFMQALLHDLNTPLAIKIINDYAKIIHCSSDNNVKIHNAHQLVMCARFLGLMSASYQEWFKGDLNEVTISELITKRNIAKQNKDWQLADQIRVQLNEIGIILEDQKDHSTIWYKK